MDCLLLQRGPTHRSVLLPPTSGLVPCSAQLSSARHVMLCPASPLVPSVLCTALAGGTHSSHSVKDKHAFLAGDNGSIYMFELSALPPPTGSLLPVCPLRGVVELPPHITLAVALTIVTPRHVPSSLSPHIFLIALGNTGEVLLLDGCVTVTDSWQWCVLHAFNPFHRSPLDSLEFSLEPYVFAAPSASASSLARKRGRQQQEVTYGLASCSIEMESAHYAVIEGEGTANCAFSVSLAGGWNVFDVVSVSLSVLCCHVMSCLIVGLHTWTRMDTHGKGLSISTTGTPSWTSTSSRRRWVKGRGDTAVKEGAAPAADTAPQVPPPGSSSRAASGWPAEVPG